MTDRIPVTIIDTIDATTPIRITPAQAGGVIHTRSFTGIYRNLRLYGAGLLCLLYFGTAWLNWGDRQAVLWDLAGRKFYIFGATFWPQDFVLLSAILIIAAFGLFFITVLAGRVWCGYTCPQSVFTWIFMRIEKLTEGERNQRLKLDAAPWSLGKLLRRSAKHALWLAVGLATALAFVGYFTPIRQLIIDTVQLNVDGSTAFWLLFFTTATYINAGWLREKVCLDMCPYSRFQSVMFDDNTLVVSYDSGRGDNRGPRRKDSDYKAQGLGDCIDCTICVQVCPTGIDIRDGLQLNCLSCGACIDACDTVMDKMGYARGLVRYTSERALNGAKTQLFRPRLLAYAAVLMVMIASFIWALQMRPLISLDVTKDRAMFRENSEGQIENIYSLKIINKTQHPQRYSIGITQDPAFALQGTRQINLAAGEIVDLPVSVVLLNPNAVKSAEQLEFVVSNLDVDTQQVSASSTFISPAAR
ncbi:cytochrome c oxidase accessory protein CcoG [Pseudomonas sp. NPDC078700]|uniref:cytochrome c oxidase accessory protein CcoG n=1 Tax=Pseudomonas sp. NPDC078700 TaxID=3364424 RepID=UPI0037C9BD6F